MTQTAVEWLLDSLDYNQQMLGIKEIIEQAKEMEKEQMKRACIRTEYEDKAWQKLMEEHFEQYYNETFKQEIEKL
jgi:hypothetical protein